MKDLVVKHNALTTASYSLALTEQRLILLAIVDARRSGQGINANDPLVITASDYAQQFGTTRQASYLALQEATETLFNRYFRYQEMVKGQRKEVKSRWVSRVAYVDDLAQIELTFAPDVVPLITELERNFTHYAIGQISSLRSTYAVRLYELLISWRGTGSTGIIELEKLRNQLGVAENEYRRMHHFKARVLDQGINQINTHTDITARYRQHKKGRRITGFSFDFKFKKTKIPPQVKHHYTCADLDQNSALALPGESYEQALKRLNAKQH